MEGFLQHVAPQFLHPALQSFGCGAFRPIAGAFHPLYPAKAFSRHFTDQYALAQSVSCSAIFYYIRVFKRSLLFNCSPFV